MKHVHRIRLHQIPYRNAKQFLDSIRFISSIYNHLSIKFIYLKVYPHNILIIIHISNR